MLEGQLGGQGGDFVEPYVLGHEYGHHIQNLLGTMGQVRTQQGPTATRSGSSSRPTATPACGPATPPRPDDGHPSPSSTRPTSARRIDSAKTVGDDRIQQKSGGRVNPEQWTHGSSEQRMRWFTTGYENGTLEACDTFSADQL